VAGSLAMMGDPSRSRCDQFELDDLVVTKAPS
jgi:hypothetical protein